MPDLSPNFCKKHYNDVSWSKGPCPYCRIDHLEALLRRAMEYLPTVDSSDWDYDRHLTILRDITDAVGGGK